MASRSLGIIKFGNRVILYMSLQRFILVAAIDIPNLVHAHSDTQPCKACDATFIDIFEM
jgi:hypothetical protein